MAYAGRAPTARDAVIVARSPGSKGDDSYTGVYTPLHVDDLADIERAAEAAGYSRTAWCRELLVRAARRSKAKAVQNG